MNSFHTAVSLIKSRLLPIEQGGVNPYVKTIIFGQTQDKDLYKKSIYPIAHIMPLAAPMGQRRMRTNASNLFAFEVAILEQRDISKRTKSLVEANGVIDKYSNDDLQDNLNVCYDILNDLISWLKSVPNDLNIQLEEVNDFQPILFKEHNLLDGWVAKFVLTVPIISSGDSGSGNPSGDGGNTFDC
jgi:hypothetical protein